MAISKEKKQAVLNELREMLTRSQFVVVTDYRGLTASQMATVRNKLRPFNSKFVVAKNTLVEKSLKDLGMPAPEDMLQGPTAIGLCYGDFRAPVRTLLDLARETDILSVKGGLLGHTVLNAQSIKTLPDLPPEEVLQAQALGAVQAPVSSFVGVLDGALRGLLYALDAHVEQLGQAPA